MLQRLAQGQRVAYVSDAGTPAVSDPGAALVALVAAAGCRVLPIPGASSALAALSVAGDARSSGFEFIGFLPARGAERAAALRRLGQGTLAQLLFEAPHRIEALAGELAALAPQRTLTLCRELTKQFETVATLPAAQLPAWLAADANRQRGEFVLVLHAPPPVEAASDGAARRRAGHAGGAAARAAAEAGRGPGGRAERRAAQCAVPGRTATQGRRCRRCRIGPGRPRPFAPRPRWPTSTMKSTLLRDMPMISREPTLERLAIAQRVLLEPFGLDEAALARALATIGEHRIDDADLYFQSTRHEGWSLEEGIVKSGSFSIDQGVGVRAVAGEKTAFAYRDELSEAALLDAARTVRTIAAAGQNKRIKVAGKPRYAGSRVLYAPTDPIATLDSAQKVALLERVEKMARAKDPRVVQVMAGLAAEYDVVLVARADGTRAADVRPLVRVSVTVIAEQNGRREVGTGGGGGRFGLGYFQDDLLQGYVEQAVNAALTNLEARPAPAGEMSVVLGPGWPGVLLHEAVGHGLEGDFNRKGSSTFAGRIGQRVAAKGVTVLDDGTIADRRGSLNVDDEGHATQRNVLIEDGILKRLHPGLDERAADGRQAHRQRPARELRACADAAHDQHLHAGRQQAEGRDHRQHQEGAVRHQLRRRAGGHHQRQVRVLGERGLLGGERQDRLPGEGRHVDRQRPRGDDPRQHDRQRPAARHRCGRVRQGRPERAGGRGPADAAHRPADGRRYGVGT